MRVLTATVLTAALVVCGCAAKLPTKPFFPVAIEKFEGLQLLPERGSVTTVQVGESMVSSAKVAKVPLMVLAATQRYVGPYRGSQQIAVDVPSGALRLLGEDQAGGRFFASKGGVVPSYDNNGNGVFTPDQTTPGGVYVAYDGTSSAFWMWDGTLVPYLTPARASVKHEMSTVELEPTAARFKRELVYSGVSQSTVAIMYREFSDGYARPSFSQELRYDLSQGNVIGYKGARFEVVRADNTGITYRVLSHLDVPPR